MRLVVDTNVLVSAALKQASRPASVVRWVSRHGGLLKSAATEAQALAVLRRPHLASKVPAGFLGEIGRLFAGAELVTVTTSIAACRDPTDDKFLELAVDGGADIIVTGDRDLLVLHPFRGIAILDPAAFVEGAGGA